MVESRALQALNGHLEEQEKLDAATGTAGGHDAISQSESCSNRKLMVTDPNVDISLLPYPNPVKFCQLCLSFTPKLSLVSANIADMWKILGFFAAFVSVCYSHDHEHEQDPIAGPLQKLWYNTIPGDGGTQASECRAMIRDNS